MNRPNGSLPSGGSGFAAGEASVAVFVGVSAAVRSAFGPRPRCRSSLASTSLMVKKVAGGRFDAASDAAASSPAGVPREAPTENSSAANADGAVQRLIENAATAISADAANFTDFIMTSPLPGTVNVCASICVPAVIGTQTGVLAA
ncbi:hypothetical protein [Bradyrhizobium sp. USDA 4454]